MAKPTKIIYHFQVVFFYFLLETTSWEDIELVWEWSKSQQAAFTFSFNSVHLILGWSGVHLPVVNSFGKGEGRVIYEHFHKAVLQNDPKDLFIFKVLLTIHKSLNNHVLHRTEKWVRNKEVKRKAILQ